MERLVTHVQVQTPAGAAFTTRTGEPVTVGIPVERGAQVFWQAHGGGRGHEAEDIFQPATTTSVQPMSSASPPSGVTGPSHFGPPSASQ